MKTLLAALALFGVVSSLVAGDASGRVDNRVLAGQVRLTADEFTRLTTPVFVQNLAYTVTNKSDGIILCVTNITAVVVIGLPNPTNNPGRRFEVHAVGACTPNLTNTTYAGSFTDLFTGTNATAGYAFASNKTAIVYSTGTNYVVRTF